MASQLITPVKPDRSEQLNRRNGGMILIVIGLVALGLQLFPDNMAGWVFAAVGVALLVYGAAVHSLRAVIPGGIFAGLGAGIGLLEGPLATAAGEVQGGTFLLVFGAGWALITLTWALAARELCWWPLIPGGILALTGALTMGGESGQQVLNWLSMVWPIVLILLGASLVINQMRQRLPQ